LPDYRKDAAGLATRTERKIQEPTRLHSPIATVLRYRPAHISAKTVESHVSAVLRKLQLSNRYELTRWATDRRLA
jgi:regulatory LuxR family protein